MDGGFTDSAARLDFEMPAPQTSHLPNLPIKNEWSKLGGQLWLERSKEDQVSIGVFPCGGSEEHGWFAAGLALFLRQTLQRETLLIDLDPEHAAIARTMRTPARPGLSEFLNSAPVGRLGCVHESEWGGVYVLPQGGAASNFDADETEPRMRWLHNTVQRDFPIVITRFPRIHTRRGAWKQCCGIPEMAVLTVTPGVSRQSELRRDTKALRKAGANLVGLVFTESFEAGDTNFLGVNR
jgi:Mrp family chromosome partitioning ATPase